MPGSIRARPGEPGGSIGYPSGRLQEEVAYVAYHFHWPREEIMSMEHAERRRWVEEIAKINRRLSQASEREA